MKKICLICAFCLCMTGCARGTPAQDAEATVQRMIEEYDANTFVRADEDFIETNFGSPDYMEDAVVYYTQNGDGTEIGVFSLSDAKHSADMERLIREYIASEKDAVASLAALYPAEELSVRLARFDRATVRSVGTVTYYVIGDDSTAQRVAKAIG